MIFQWQNTYYGASRLWNSLVYQTRPVESTIIPIPVFKCSCKILLSINLIINTLTNIDILNIQTLQKLLDILNNRQIKQKHKRVILIHQPRLQLHEAKYRNLNLLFEYDDIEIPLHKHKNKLHTIDKTFVIWCIQVDPINWRIMQSIMRVKCPVLNFCF